MISYDFTNLIKCRCRNYLDRLGAKRVWFRGLRNSLELMAVREVQLSSFLLQRKEKSRDNSKGQAVYLLTEDRICQIKREKLLCKFTQCNSSKMADCADGKL